MALENLHKALQVELDILHKEGKAKGAERVITGVKPAHGQKGPRYFLAGHGRKEFIMMNSNSYCGLSLHPEVIKAEEEAVRRFGTSARAVRFISTYRGHIELETALAKFHGREDAMLFSSAYATSLGVIVPLTTSKTAIISDELNHNCIINAMKLARPIAKEIYKHNDMLHLTEKLWKCAVDKADRVIVVTDGIFSMRGDHAPLSELYNICASIDKFFPEGIFIVVDDSHGVGAFGATGRGTEEYTGAKADILVGTLGKAFGVEGGYVVSSAKIIEYLREKAETYIYSNPIAPGAAVAATKAIFILDSPEGEKILAHLRVMTMKFEKGLVGLGFETIPGDHPVVPIVVRDTPKTKELVKYLIKHRILATGLTYPVVPDKEEEIRFQVSAEHTEHDIDYVLKVLKKFKQREKKDEKD